MADKTAQQTFTRKTMNRPLAEEIIARYGNQKAAAAAIRDRCRDNDGNVPSVDAIRQWFRDAIINDVQPKILDPVRERVINQIMNLIDEAGVPLEALDHDNPIDSPKLKSGYHDVVTRGPKTVSIDPTTGKKVVTQGPPVVTRASSKRVTVTLNPIFKAPKWPLIEPARPITIKSTVRPQRPKSSVKTIVVISDTQIGYLRDIYDLEKKTPIHDENAINVAIQIVADLQPDQLGYIGDFLDLPEMSRWLQLPEFVRTTQPSIQRGYEILKAFEDAAGPDRDPTQFVAGNHDRRLREYVVKNATAAYGIRPASIEGQLEPPDDGHTIPWALRFKELGIEYVGEYPGGEWWITDRCVVRHNPEGPNAYEGTVLCGHTHRVKRDDYSRRSRFGPEFNTIIEIGCLCSLEKFPDPKSLAATIVPSNRGFVKNWKHSFAVVSVLPNGSHAVELVEYFSPRHAMFRGKEYFSSLAA